MFSSFILPLIFSILALIITSNIITLYIGVIIKSYVEEKQKSSLIAIFILSVIQFLGFLAINITAIAFCYLHLNIKTTILFTAMQTGLLMLALILGYKILSPCRTKIKKTIIAFIVVLLIAAINLYLSSTIVTQCGP